MSSRTVAVTGLGLVTPAGIGVGENWQRICGGRSAAARDPELADLPIDISCRVPGFEPVARLGATHARRLDRHVQFALVAAAEALADAGLDHETWDGARVAVVMGTGAGGPGSSYTQHQRLIGHGSAKVSAHALPMLLPNMVAGQLAIDFHATGPNLVTCTACAAGTTAIGMARYLLLSGACDVAVTGGAEAAVNPLFMAGFARLGALSRRLDEPARASRPFDAARDGFVAGEGAAVLVMERVDDAHARRADVHGYLAGYGASADAHHVTAPEPDGRGTEQAMRAALADAGAEPGDVGHANAHGTSTPLNDLTEAMALWRIFGDGVVVTSTKGVTGHMLGATGAVEAVYTLLALKNQCVPPTANVEKLDPDIPVEIATGAVQPRRMSLAINNSCGFGGQNAALLFSRDA
ncbi:beta-ketoacyl-[acyl-carrier-protein] synthase family protein [Micromonospora sp. NPDC023814]|uniref:beta-ketoacyl-[acyl-carrier-protein] synthase family protein n=1 Tax=Micromonospora sp. NPDC023814 TaxID=3154596 RepID=UPI0033F7571B